MDNQITRHCKYCNAQQTMKVTKTPHLIHDARLDCETCGKFWGWKPKEKSTEGREAINT